MKSKDLQPRLLDPAKLAFEIEGQLSFPDKRKKMTTIKINNKMALNTYLTTIKSKKQNKQENRNRFTDTENILTVARWERGVGDWVETGKGLRSTNWLLQSSHGDVKYSIGNIINNILVTMYSVRLV